MNVPCSVIQDLLPLYHDGICSEESRQLVDAHLGECAECKDVLHTMNEKLILGDDVEKAAPLLSVRMTWNKEKRRVFVKALSIALAVCLLLLTAWWGLTCWDCVPLTGEDFTLLRLSRLEDGHIHVRTTCAYGGVTCSIRYDAEKNALYEVQKRPILAQRKALPDESILYAGMRSAYQGGWGEVIFDPDGEPHWSSKDGTPLPIKAYYFGDPDSDEAVLIWEEGMQIPAADEETEIHWARIQELEKN